MSLEKTEKTEQAFNAGQEACQQHPPKWHGSFVGGRPLGLNPHELFSEEWAAWNDGYEKAARAKYVGERDPGCDDG